MKLLMMTTNASLLDGINRHILTVTIALSRLPEVTVAVCTTHPRGELHETLEAYDIRTYSLNASNGHKLSILWRYIRILRDFKPNIVHIHVMPILAGIVLKYAFPFIKNVCTIHGIGIDTDKTCTSFGKIKKSVTAVMNFFTQPKIDYTCYVSNGVLEVYKKFGYYSSPSCVVYNPAPLLIAPKTACLHNLLKIDKKCKIIGTACRIAAIKQPVLFTQVMCEVLKRSEDVHAVVLGDGDQNLINAMNEYVKDEGLASRFHFMGYRQDAASLIQDMDCFIMTSKQEGMPTTILEAFSQGTLVAFMEGGGGLVDLADLNDGEYRFAISVAALEVELMSRRILEYLEDKELYDSCLKNAKALLKTEFDVCIIVKQLNQIYRQVLCL